MRGRVPIDLTGKVFGRLTVIERAGACHFGIMWKCNCTCGKSVDVVSANLNRGNTKSCGCLKIDLSRLCGKNIKHGESILGKSSTEYSSWSAMRRRCSFKNNPQYHNYGGRGISICERWLQSFQNFLEDVGRKPTPNHSLDRYPDNNGNYCPGNVRWATKKEQQNNKRTNRVLIYNGVSKTLKLWSEETGIKYKSLMYRINKGQSLETIFSTLNKP